MDAPLPHRTRIVSIRFRPAEWESVRERAALCGLSPSRYLRRTALGSVPRARPGAVERAAVHQLARIGNNLNQLAKRANSGLPVGRGELLEVLAQVRGAAERL
jgi:hypothetical protein